MNISRRSFVRSGCILVGLIAACPAPRAFSAAPTPATPKRPTPNTQRAAPVLFPGDARLARPVRLEASGTPLPEILASLSAQTKVSLKGDPSLQELKAVALARGLPLRTAMQQLAALFHAEWSRRGSGNAAAYTLARSPAVRRQAGDLRERFWREQVSSVGALMAAIKAEDPAARLVSVNPTVARKWHRPQIPAALHLFDYATRGRYVGGAVPHRPSRAYGELTPEQQAVAREALVALAAWREALGDPDQARGLRGASQEPETLVFEGFLTEMYSPNPTAPEMKVGDRVLSLRARSGSGQMVLEMGIHIGPIPLPATDDPDRVPAPPSHPALALALELPGDDKGVPLHRLLPEVAQQGRLAVFADYFYSRPRPIEVGSRWEGSLEALLRRLERSAHTEWTLDGPTLRLANRRWYVDEMREPPRSLLTSLAATLRQPDRLEIDDCVRVAALDDQQLDGLKAWAGAQDAIDGLANQIQTLADHISDARPLLRLYNSLGPGQRQALPTGLTLESLQIRQQPVFLEAALRLRPTAPADERARMRLRLDTGENRVVFVALFPNDIRVERPLPIRPPGFFR